LKFHRCAADEVSRTVPAEFDLVVMFNTLYCFPDQRRALQQAAAVTVAGGRLAIFDYSAPSRTPEVKQFYQSYARTHWVPIVTDEIEQTLDQTGWKLCSLEDQSSNYRRWYRELIDKIDARQDAIVSAHGDRWFEYARQRYQTLLDAIEAAIIGGVIIHAEKKCG
jgi:SAM-dependent methyltransferase